MAVYGKRRVLFEVDLTPSSLLAIAAFAANAVTKHVDAVFVVGEGKAHRKMEFARRFFEQISDTFPDAFGSIVTLEGLPSSAAWMDSLYAGGEVSDYTEAQIAERYADAIVDESIQAIVRLKPPREACALSDELLGRLFKEIEVYEYVTSVGDVPVPLFDKFENNPKNLLHIKGCARYVRITEEDMIELDCLTVDVRATEWKTELGALFSEATSEWNRLEVKRRAARNAAHAKLAAQYEDSAIVVSTVIKREVEANEHFLRKFAPSDEDDEKEAVAKTHRIRIACACAVTPEMVMFVPYEKGDELRESNAFVCDNSLAERNRVGVMEYVGAVINFF